MRSFIAIELPGEVKSALADLQNKLKDNKADIRWVKPDNIHLTLKFLGDIEEKNIGNVIKQLEGACAKHSFFNLAMSGIGVFPNTRAPRVLWAGIQCIDQFAELHKDIEDGLVSVGFQKEGRKFSPHLTLGRFRSFKGKDIISSMLEMHKDDQPVLIKVTSVSLMKSELGRDGARYSTISEVPLAFSEKGF